jgi:hypothetical protein
MECISRRISSLLTEQYHAMITEVAGSRSDIAFVAIMAPLTYQK